jgi:DNA (cytosine-5)-methyltransferase 1
VSVWGVTITLTGGNEVAGPISAESRQSGLSLVGMFSGIAGLESGLTRAGFMPVFVCESWEPARRVLTHRLPSVPLGGDVRQIDALPHAQLLAAGFPCTDLSLAGRLMGITGKDSGLVEHVFRLAGTSRPDWILLENVPHMLALHKGAAMRFITDMLEGLGYTWAYRTVDARFTGTPQKRRRVLLLAAKSGSPEDVILEEDAGAPSESSLNDNAFGFYWTEGRRGLGLVQDAMPPLKGGSTIGILSQPAIWLRDAPVGFKIVMPSLGDGEQLQGLPLGWTVSAAAPTRKDDHRWKLVGNAVNTHVATWIGLRIAGAICGEPQRRTGSAKPFDRLTKWPEAGWGKIGEAWRADVSAWPQSRKYAHLSEVVSLESAIPLSYRATTGFLSRLVGSGVQCPEGFIFDLQEHRNYMLSARDS